MIRIIFLIFTISLGVIAGEHVMVWQKSVDLFEDNKIRKNLFKGQWVEATVLPENKKYYKISLNGKTYTAARKGFRTLDEVIVEYKKSLLTYEAEIKKNKRLISNIDSDMIVRQIERLELERDTAISYGKIVSYNDGNNSGFYTSYSTLLSKGKFKKLMKEWNKEHEKSVAEKNKLMNLNQKYTIIMADTKAELARFADLAEILAGGANTDVRTLYVMKDETPLYNRLNKVEKYVNTGDMVKGKKSSKYPGWYIVAHEGGKYLTKESFVKDIADYKKYIYAEQVKSEMTVVELEAEVERQQFYLKMYNGITRQLEVDKFLQNGFGLVKNVTVPIDKDRTFTIKSPNADDLYVNIVEADKVLKNWKRTVEEITSSSLANQKKVLELKKYALDLDTVAKKLKDK